MERVLLRKTERSYSRSISLREDQLRGLENAGVKNLSELVQKLIGEWLLLRDKEEAARLRERAELLSYKFRVMTGEEAGKHKWEESSEVLKEVNRLKEKAEEIERNIEELTAPKPKVLTAEERAEKVRHALADVSP